MGSAYDRYRAKKGASTNAPAPYESQYSTGGFIGNIFGDLGDIAKGLGTLGVTVAKDVTGGALDAITPFDSGPLAYEHDWTLDDMAKALPGVIKEDYTKRYASGIDEFAKGVYEDPLAFLGDIATVLTAGGYGVAKGAQAASKGGNVADDLARLASGAEDVGTTARVVDKILPGAKDRALIESMGHSSTAPLGGTRQVLRGAQDAGRTSVEELAREFNPARRLFREKVVDRALTRPVRALERERDAKIEAVLGDSDPEALVKRLEKGEKPTQLEVDAVLLDKSIKLAESHGITRVPRAVVAKGAFGRSGQVARLMDRITGESKTAHIGKRDADMDEWHQVLQQLPDEELRNFHSTLQIEVPDAVAPRLSFDEVVDRVANPAVLETPLGRSIAETVAPHIRRLREMEGDPDIDPLEIQAGQRVIEAVAGEPLATLGDELTPAVKTMDEVRLLNFKKQASKFIEDGGSYSSLFRRQYMPMRVAEKRQLGLESFEEATDPFILDKGLQDAGKKTPVYYPHYESLTKNNSGLLMSTNMSGARKAAQVSKVKKSEGVLFERHLKGIKDAYETDPTDAYSRLAAEMVKHDEMENWIARVANEIGRPVTALDEIGTGEVVMNLDGVKRMIRNRKTAMEEVHENLEGGMEMDDAFASAIESLFATPDRDVAELLAKRGALIAIPKAAAKKIEAQSKFYLNNAGLRLFWDAPVNAWRNITLYAAPRYYINNVFGNTTFLKLQGGKLAGVVRQLDKGYREAVRKAIPSEALPDVEQGFYSSTVQRSTHLGAAEQTTAGQFVKGVKEAKIGRTIGKGRDHAQEFNQFLENVYRRESFMTAMEKQASKRGVKLAGNSWVRSKKRLDQISELGANEKIVKAALDEMDVTMNNYQRLSSFERNIVRRFVAPFWPFYKHAARTLISLPYKHPAKSRALMWINDVSEELDALGPRPEFLEDFIALGPGGDPGETSFLSTRGANPFSGVLESPTSLVNPFVQAGWEQATGRDSFTGRQFTAEDVYNDPITGMQMRTNPETGVPEPVERRLGGLLSGVGPDLSEMAWEFAGPLNTLRDAAGGGARYSGTGDVMEDPAGNPLYPISPVDELLKLLGVSTIDYDLNRYQEGLSEAQKRAFNALSQR